jgi:hypothetical protein
VCRFRVQRAEGGELSGCGVHGDGAAAAAACAIGYATAAACTAVAAEWEMRAALPMRCVTAYCKCEARGSTEFYAPGAAAQATHCVTQSEHGSMHVGYDRLMSVFGLLQIFVRVVLYP